MLCFVIRDGLHAALLRTRQFVSDWLGTLFAEFLRVRRGGGVWIVILICVGGNDSPPALMRLTHTKPHTIMKTLLTLAGTCLALALASCTSDGRCIFAGKKKDCCATGAACCSKKASDCKTCKH